ncbi:hypothetical protein AADG42_04190 [Ammonicoccus fulvus]|uniref:DUF1049 domain-containing protein n=1 Tax=Ammonicoccus fulvus TaxID=3138240 RepID=A0ABZ3FNV0_9ACTN
MKILKLLLGVLGLAALITTVVFIVRTWDSVRGLWFAANANRSQAFDNPINRIYLTIGLAALAGLLIGLAIGLPGRTAGAIRRQALQDASDVREASIRRRVGGLDDASSGGATSAESVRKSEEEQR